VNISTSDLRARGFTVEGGRAVRSDEPAKAQRAKRGTGAKSKAKAKRLAAALADHGRKAQGIELRPPPSLNAIYRRGRGHVYLTDEARQWKEAAYARCLADRLTPFQGDVEVEVIAVNTNLDSDNGLKLLFDALQGDRGMYLNDRQIRRHTVTREDQGIPAIFVIVQPAAPSAAGGAQP
jgi:Holliday junction resolvase RusA-like endonuclease